MCKCDEEEQLFCLIYNGLSVGHIHLLNILFTETKTQREYWKSVHGYKWRH